MLTVIKWVKTLAMNLIVSLKQDGQTNLSIATWAYTSFFGGFVNTFFLGVYAMLFFYFFSPKDQLTQFMVSGEYSRIFTCKIF
jgi:hypothetical protein